MGPVAGLRMRKCIFAAPLCAYALLAGAPPPLCFASRCINASPHRRHVAHTRVWQRQTKTPAKATEKYRRGSIGALYLVDGGIAHSEKISRRVFHNRAAQNADGFHQTSVWRRGARCGRGGHRLNSAGGGAAGSVSVITAWRASTRRKTAGSVKTATGSGAHLPRHGSVAQAASRENGRAA